MAEKLVDYLQRQIKAAWREVLAQQQANSLPEITADSIHDYRVALRNLSAVLELAVGRTPGKKVKKLKKRIKKLLRALGALRDRQLHLAWAKNLAREEPAIRLFIEYLGKEEEQARIDMIRVLRDNSLKPYKKVLKKIIQPCGKENLRQLIEKNANRKVLKETRTTARQTIRQKIDGAYERMLAGINRADPDDLASLHRLRIDLKKFRYLVENTRPFFGITGQGIKTLRQIQGALGDIQDLRVRIDQLKYFSAGNGLTARGLMPVIADAERDLAAMVGEMMPQIHQLEAVYSLTGGRKDNASAGSL